MVFTIKYPWGFPVKIFPSSNSMSVFFISLFINYYFLTIIWLLGLNQSIDCSQLSPIFGRQVDSWDDASGDFVAVLGEEAQGFERLGSREDGNETSNKKTIGKP